MNKTILGIVTAWVILFVSIARAEVMPIPKVLIIGIDGCRPDALLVADTPNLDALTAAGSVSYTATNEKTHGGSGPNWTSMLSGVRMERHGVIGNGIGLYDNNTKYGFYNYDYVRYPHFFSYLRAADPTAYLASYSNWGSINTGMRVSTWANSVGSSDQDTTANMARDLLMTGDPDAIFVQLDKVDGGGHTYGFSPTEPGYIDRIEWADDCCGRILNALYNRPGYIDGTEDWLILVTTDHGGTKSLIDGKGDHDQPSGGAEVWTTFVIAAGNYYKPGVDLGSPIIEDIAVTALNHMGVNTSTLGLDGRVMPLVGVPEPSTLVGLAGLALGGLVLAWFRRSTPVC